MSTSVQVLIKLLISDIFSLFPIVFGFKFEIGKQFFNSVQVCLFRSITVYRTMVHFYVPFRYVNNSATKRGIAKIF